MAWIRLIRYLPYIIEIGRLVVDILREVDRIKDVRLALKEAKAGNPTPLKNLVERM